MEGDDDITDEEVPNNVNNFVNNTLANYAPKIPSMMSLMHHQFRGYKYLCNVSPRSFSNMFRIPFRTSILRGSAWVNELLQGHPEHFYEQLHMDKRTFQLLCEKIVEMGHFIEHQRTKVQIEKCVAIFLHTIGMHQRHRISAKCFQHSPETIS